MLLIQPIYGTMSSDHGLRAAEAGAASMRDDTAKMDWNGTVNLTANFTVESGQRLVIAPGTNVLFGLDIVILVKGELVCGQVGGLPVKLLNDQDRLSGGFVLQNCRDARFTNTYFEDLGLGIEAIYSVVTLTDCDLNNTGIGVFAFESRVGMTGCNFTNCDVGANLVRCNTTVTGCEFEDDLQGLILNADVSLIQTFYDTVISLVAKGASPVAGPNDFRALVDTTGFVQTGVGVAAISLTGLKIDYCAFELCKKGFEARFSPGTVRSCWFELNAIDFEIVGRQTSVQENITQPVNYTYYHEFSIKALGIGGGPLSSETLTVSHPGMSNMTYRTDANGSVDQIVLLMYRSKSSNSTTYSEYRLTVSGLKGYYPLDDSPTIVLTQDKMVNGEKKKDRPYWVYALVLISIIILVTLIFWLWQGRKGKGDSGPSEVWRIR